MSAQMAYEAEPGFDDGDDDGPVVNWMDIALAYAGVLNRVSERGPLFAAAIATEFDNLRKDN